MTTMPQIPPPESLCLPTGYIQQSDLETHDRYNSEPYWNAHRIAASGAYQHHVYRWASTLIRRDHLTSVLDIGCGPGTKLDAIIRPVCQNILGVDLESSISTARTLHPAIPFESVDLDRSSALSGRTFDLIICADVIEHLADPRVLLTNIRSACHANSCVILSTPDRDRTRGRSCRASVQKEHVREWSRSEFSAFLLQERFRIHQSRLLPFADANLLLTAIQDLPYRLKLANRSPLRCHCLLCSPLDLP